MSYYGAQQQQQSSSDDFEYHHARTRRGHKVDIRLDKQLPYRNIGHGAFANVYKLRSKIGARATELVALKKPMFPMPTEEADLMRELDHVNIVVMKFSFEEGGIERFAMELLEDGDLYSFLNERKATGEFLGLGIYAEVFTYQLFRGLAYLNRRNIAHRDLKSENLLISKATGVLKITDFGCAVKLRRGRAAECEVGTKEFRAPEMLLGSTRYTTSIDVWAAAVVLSEVCAGWPVFGEGPRSNWEQYERIEAFLGHPSQEDCAEMGVRFSFRWLNPFGAGRTRAVRSHVASAPVHNRAQAAALMSAVFRYSPSRRLTAWEACAHDFFRRIRNGSGRLRLPNGNPLPSLVDFSSDEVAEMSGCLPRDVLQTMMQACQ